MIRRLATIGTLLHALLCLGLHAQGGARYYERSIPARDGKTLAADLYTNDTARPKPVILIQTPYNKNYYRLSINIPPEAGGSPFPYDSAHYNYVVVDWRGFYGSKAASVANYDRGLDGYDAVEWIAAQPWCNGSVGTWGPSALGAIQFMTAKHRPPHLVCSVPLVKDFKTKYTDSYYGGEFRKEHIESQAALGLSQTALILAHPTNDIVWQVAERSSDVPDSFAVPMLLISGWFDFYPDDIIRAFDDLRERSDPAVRAAHKLIMGPWMHGRVGKGTQGVLTFPNAAGMSDSIALRFFDYYMRHVDNDYPAEPLIRYYQMGTNQWRTTTDWNNLCAGMDTLALYLAADRQLLSGLPADRPDTLRADPRDPSPTYGGARLAPNNPDAVDGPQDIRAVVESRGDVLVYSTPVLERDIAVTGGVTVELYVTADRPDADYAVRLCDVYPDGRSVLLTQGIRRARFRNGFGPQDTAAMTPGTQYRVAVGLQNIAHTFLAGHRLRVDITGSNFPQYDINPNTGGPLYTAGDTLVAVSAISRTGPNASRVVMPVAALPGSVGGSTAGAGLWLDVAGPNPSRGVTRFAYTLPNALDVRLELFDMLGRCVAVPVAGRLEAGQHGATWHADDALPNGAYIVRLRAGTSMLQQRVVLAR